MAAEPSCALAAVLTTAIRERDLAALDLALVGHCCPSRAEFPTLPACDC